MEQFAYFSLMFVVFVVSLTISSTLKIRLNIDWVGEHTLTPFIMGVISFLIYFVLRFFMEFEYFLFVCLLTGFGSFGNLA